MGRFSGAFFGFVTSFLCGELGFSSGTGIANQQFPKQPDVSGFGWPQLIQNASMKYLPRVISVKRQYAYGFYFKKSCGRFCCNMSQHIKSQDNKQAVQCHEISRLNEEKINLSFHKHGKSYVIPRSNNICVIISATTETNVTYLCSNLTEDYRGNKSEIAVFTPKNPTPYAFGWPVPFLFKVTMNTLPVEGIVHYDLLMNRTCPSFQTTGLRPLPWCQRIVNQSCSSVQEAWNCTICSTTDKCNKLLGISQDHDVCLALRVTTSVGVFFSKAVERSYIGQLFIFSPPKNVRLLAEGKGKLTAVWDSPDGVDNDTLRNSIVYVVFLADASGSCAFTTATVPASGKIWNHTYSFTALNAWSRYSVSICWSLIEPIVDKARCTCRPRHLLAGPVFQRTLPEAPSVQPQLLPCEASCHSNQMSVTLKWQAFEKHEWNGIPRNSFIRLWNITSSNSTGGNVSELGKPMLFNVSLASNYTGSLLSYTIENLDSRLTYLVEIQFCSTGGCSLSNTKRRLDCESCGGVIDRPTRKGSESQGSYGTEIGIGVSVLVILLLVLTLAVVKTRKRRRLQSLQDRIGDLGTPHIYHEVNQSDMMGEEGPYSELVTETNRLLVVAERASTPEPQWI